LKKKILEEQYNIYINQPNDGSVFFISLDLSKSNGFLHKFFIQYDSRNNKLIEFKIIRKVDQLMKKFIETAKKKRASLSQTAKNKPE
jgi:hypothetical protein